jgi:RsiW-degrading membrane proteinase PrsW (M82 family)
MDVNAPQGGMVVDLKLVGVGGFEPPTSWSQSRTQKRRRPLASFLKMIILYFCKTERGHFLGINPALITVLAVVTVAFLIFVISRVGRAQRRLASTSPEEPPITLCPKTSSGKWSLGLAIAFVLLFIVAAVPLGDRWGFKESDELVNPTLTVVVTIILVGTAIATLVSGFSGAIKHKERSILVFLGMLVAFWLGILGAIGEFLI